MAVKQQQEFDADAGGWYDRISRWFEKSTGNVYLLPAVLLVLFLSIFPLIVSLYLSFARIRFVRGGFDISFIGLDNYDKILLGSGQRQFLGRFGEMGPIGGLILLVFIGFLVYWLARYAVDSGFRIFGLVIRGVTAFFAAALLVLAVITLSGRGLPGTLVVTLIFVFAGVFFQYMIGLGLALLVTQNLPGKRFFRVIFLLPMMATPVGIGFLFRMLTDTQIGPFAPVWQAVGLSDFSMLGSPTGARAAILVGDVWQWTPFMFIVLLAALEGVPREPIEAALVDGANRWQLFHHITLPQVVPVSTTLILIRLIEAFKIIDLPQVLTRGGPGTATESVTLQSFNQWKALDLGISAALAYMLLFVVTFVALVHVNFIRRKLLESV